MISLDIFVEIVVRLKFILSYFEIRLTTGFENILRATGLDILPG